MKRNVFFCDYKFMLTNTFEYNPFDSRSITEHNGFTLQSFMIHFFLSFKFSLTEKSSSIFLSLSLTHTQTDTTHTHTISLSLSLSLTHTHTLSLSLIHTRIHAISFSLSLSSSVKHNNVTLSLVNLTRLSWGRGGG